MCPTRTSWEEDDLRFRRERVKNQSIPSKLGRVSVEQSQDLVGLDEEESSC